MINLLDTPGLTGVLSITKIPNGSLPPEGIFEKLNLITTLSKQRIVSLIYNTSITPDPVTSIHIGSGGTYDLNGLYPQPESANQTNLNTPISGLVVPVVYTVDPSGTAVTFTATLDQSTGNGHTLSEAGLFTLGGNMFNVKNHPGIPKTSDFSLQYSWVIRLS